MSELQIQAFKAHMGGFGKGIGKGTGHMGKETFARGNAVKVRGPDTLGSREHVGKVGEVRSGPDNDGDFAVFFPMDAGAAWAEFDVCESSVTYFKAASLERVQAGPLPMLLGKELDGPALDADAQVSTCVACSAACISLLLATPLLVLASLQVYAGQRFADRDCDPHFARHLELAGAGGLALGLVPYLLSLVALYKLRFEGCCSWCVAGCCGVLLPVAGVCLTVYAFVMVVLGFVLWGDFEEGHCDEELRSWFYGLAIVPTFVSLALGPALSCLRCLKRTCCGGEGQ